MEVIKASAVALVLASAWPLAAQDEPLAPAAAAGAEVFYSTDSDGSATARTAVDLDLRNRGDERRMGFRLEKAWYDPAGSETRDRERVFVRWADRNDALAWSALVGTDGHSVIGSASIHDDAPDRKEVFIERDVVETRRGLDEGIYATFLGAAIDLPASDRTTVTLLGGLQEFTGDNLRLHARANLVHVVAPDLGLSAQLRTRYFRNSHPFEYDYYSPRWYAQVLPVIQMRRFTDGWELVGAAGIGLQRDSQSEWGRASFAQLRFRSPPNARDWSVHGELTYTDAPSSSAVRGPGYAYVQTALGVLKRF